MWRPSIVTRRRFLVLGARLAASAGVIAMPKNAAALTVRPSALYRSEAGRAAVMRIYDRKLTDLPLPHESQMLETRFGPTHVLTLGPRSGPPLLALHGVNFGGPFMADIVAPLADKFRIFIPDTVGQPGRSAEVQPDPSARNYAGWVTDVLDGLGVDAASVLGVSFGGAIALDLAALAPHRISKAVLVVPGGFQSESSTAISLLFRLFLPWLAYRFFPDRNRVARTVYPLAWEMDEAYYDFFDALLRHVNWLIPPPGPFSGDDLQNFHAPTAIYAARQDIFFPGDALVYEARAVIPNLVEAEVFDSSHFPTKAMQSEIARRMAAFLA